MNENQLTIVKECEFDKPIIQKIDFIIDNCCRHCHKKNFHTFEYKGENDTKLTNITINETINLPIFDKSLGLYDLYKKLTVARQRGFIFNEINKRTIKIYSHQQNMNICYYLKHRIPIMHRLFFRIISQNPEYVERFCNDRNMPFHSACRRWCLYNYPQCWYLIKNLKRKSLL